ncbi:thiol:disulfide interchange protein DsbA [Novimethylophilus kurashikiensis]|uniref:Thiol:disulfide interchange protein DsbA n=1 Tax=Novimethylophilus kurashikiensis TaxID=1825523 RepID=A0A2R5FAG2_9PROT|nr:thiol:disulfide interchange protein DsbA/DsbL [Novimethylophilus kurashikiensis]GBG14538.1 thiol:disulfide interchange protein DsbA [Novimethylophilus kurashikiensis]
MLIKLLVAEAIFFALTGAAYADAPSKAPFDPKWQLQANVPQTFRPVVGEAPVKHAIGQPVEVVEYFSYGCPHCADFNPELEKWAAAQGARIQLKRLPISFNRTAWKELARMHWALTDMGVMTPTLSQNIYKAIHKDHVPLDALASQKMWLGAQHIDVKKFEEALKNKTIDDRINQAATDMMRQQLVGVPSMKVGNQYVVPADAPEKMLDNSGKLVNKLIQEEVK